VTRLCGDVTDQSALAKSGCAAHDDDTSPEHRTTHGITHNILILRMAPISRFNGFITRTPRIEGAEKKHHSGGRRFTTKASRQREVLQL
jgi:hypothetical protein